MRKIILITITLLCSTVFAANEIQQQYATGQTLYAVIIDSETLKIWDGDTFENTTTKPALAWTECDIALTEDSFIKGLYTGTFPATITAGRYLVWTYIGPALTATDTYVGGDYYDWTGKGEISYYDVWLEILSIDKSFYGGL